MNPAIEEEGKPLNENSEKMESEDCSNWWIPACSGHYHNSSCYKWEPWGPWGSEIEIKRSEILRDRHMEKESGISTSHREDKMASGIVNLVIMLMVDGKYDVESRVLSEEDLNI